MPTYEYACEACGHKFEEFQSITAKPITKCPVCKKNKVKRLISAGAGFIFKGSGFYITDYRDEKYKAAAKGDAAPAAAKSDGATTDATKPATPAKTDAAPAKADAAPPKTESKPTKAPARSASAKK